MTTCYQVQKLYYDRVTKKETNEPRLTFIAFHRRETKREARGTRRWSVLARLYTKEATDLTTFLPSVMRICGLYTN